MEESEGEEHVLCRSAANPLPDVTTRSMLDSVFAWLLGNSNPCKARLLLFHRHSNITEIRRIKIQVCSRIDHACIRGERGAPERAVVRGQQPWMHSLSSPRS